MSYFGPKQLKIDLEKILILTTKKYKHI